MQDSTVKKTLIITVSIIAAVMLVLGAVAFGFNYMYKCMREYKSQQKVDKEALVMNYFLDQLEDPDEVESIEITFENYMGNGGPVPFAGTPTEMYEYTLLIDEEYKVVIIIDWDDDYYRIQRNDYPGELK